MKKLCYNDSDCRYADRRSVHGGICFRACLTNINRQIHAIHKTVGKPKVEVMRDRILEINPRAEVQIHQTFYLPDIAEELLHEDYDYIVERLTPLQQSWISSS